MKPMARISAVMDRMAAYLPTRFQDGKLPYVFFSWPW
jgi:hypothetical protein